MFWNLPFPDEFPRGVREDGQSFPARFRDRYGIRQGRHVRGGIPNERVFPQEPQSDRALHTCQKETRHGGPQLLRSPPQRPHRNLRESNFRNDVTYSVFCTHLSLAVFHSDDRIFTLGLRGLFVCRISFGEMSPDENILKIISLKLYRVI